VKKCSECGFCDCFKVPFLKKICGYFFQTKYWFQTTFWTNSSKCLFDKCRTAKCNGALYLPWKPASRPLLIKYILFRIFRKLKGTSLWDFFMCRSNCISYKCLSPFEFLSVINFIIYKDFFSSAGTICFTCVFIYQSCKN
jgi:hypothetical protein